MTAILDTPIGINPTDATDLDERHVRRLRHLVIGRRTLGGDARLELLARRQAAGTMLREVVVGVYQGMEFILQRGMRTVADKLGMVGTHVLCSAAAVAPAKVWRLTLGRDQERSLKALASLLGDEAAS